jgi:predicted alpha/beta hydrolase
MISHLRETHPQNALVVLGHSVGGQMIGMTESSKKIDAMILVGSQTPYWRNFSTLMKPRLWLFWNVLIPSLTKLFGFFPASKLGLFEDLPKLAALQWRRWAKSSNYIFDEHPHTLAKFEALDQPMLVFSFEDDSIAPPNAVADLLRFYKNTKREHRHLSPDDLSTRSIGHFGFFRKRFQNTLWQDSLDWLKKNARKRQRIAA